MSDRDDDDDRPRRRDDDRLRRDDDRPRRRDDDDDRPRRRDDRDYDDRDDFDDRPRRRESASNGAATAALVLGILSFFCLVFTGVPAIIFGFVGLSKAKRTGTGKGMAVAGLVLGLLTSLMIVPIMIGLLLPAVKKVRQAADNATTGNNFKQIGLGVQNYHDQFLQFPTAYYQEPPLGEAPDGAAAPPADPLAQPAVPPANLEKQLSWRVTILPFIEQDIIYRELKRDQPWDSPANRPIADRFIMPYADPSQKTDPTTRNRVFVGPGALFDPTRKGGPQNLATITDGSSNTILAVEAADKVTWPQYKELPFDMNGPLPAFGRPGSDVFVAVFADGHIQTFRKTVNPAVMKQAITADGGEVFDIDQLDR